MNNLYKYSQFNIEVDTKEDGSIYIFNTYTCKGMWIDKEDQKLIMNKTDIDPLDISETIIQNGLVVEVEIDELERIKQESTALLSKMNMLFINIVLTRACNFKCKYCFEKDAIGNTFMNLEVASKIIEYIKKQNRNVIIKFFGGEPLLNLKIIRYILNEIKHINIKNKIEMYTNGRLLTPDITDELVEKGVNGNIIITIDGLKDYYTYIKGCNESDYNTVISNIKYAQNKLNIILQLNISSENKDTIKEVVEELRVNGINTKIITNQVRPCNSTDVNNCNSICFSDYENIRRSILGNRIIKRNITGCEGRLHHYFVVDIDGSILLCEHLIGKNEHIIGNIKDMQNINIENIKKNSVWDNNRIIEDCKECKMLPICNGECSEMRYIGGIKCEQEQRLQELITDIKTSISNML